MASISTAPAVQAQTVVLPDEIWEEVLLRLAAAADLARASAACSSFRRIVSHRRFLRRFRSLRRPAVLGFVTSSRVQRFVPVQPPHRSAREARALELAADFTFSFLPDASAWCCRYVLDGRVLLSQSISTKIQFEDFLVCDPLYRRYVKIPRLPDDLLAAIPHNVMAQHVIPALVPAGQNDEEEEESFRIICTVQLKDKVIVFVFSSCSQTWRGVTSTICLPSGLIAYMPCYAHGCMYWMFCGKGSSLMLDTSEMKFSITELPPHNVYSMRAIVEAEEGRLGFLTIGDGTIDLYCNNQQSNGVGAQEWLHNKLIPLPKESGINYTWVIESTAGGYVTFGACADWYEKKDFEYFVLDIKTLLVEKLCTTNIDAIFGFPYARFPPPFALPSI